MRDGNAQCGPEMIIRKMVRPPSTSLVLYILAQLFFRAQSFTHSLTQLSSGYPTSLGSSTEDEYSRRPHFSRRRRPPR